MKYPGIMVLTMLIGALGAVPAGAVRIYLNPSDQIHNWSPDKTYCEADNMQDVAKRLAARLSARGFEVKNSDGKTMADSCNEANEWPADIFVSLHSNASGGPAGWHKAHGTNTLYFQPRDGSPPNPISIELATRCDEKCVEKFTPYGRGHNFRITADLPFLGYNLYVLRKTNMPGTLVEGLFHDNEEDTAVLKTEEGRDAYAQAVYEALCDHLGMAYYPDAPLLDPSGPAANNADGRVEFSALGKDGHMLVCRQTGVNGAWDKVWLDIEGKTTGAPAMARSASGRLDLFARGPGDRIWHKVQSSRGSERWNGWYDIGGQMASDPVAGVNADGRLSVFAIGMDKRVLHAVQRSVNSSLAWDGWYGLGASDAARLAVCSNADGRLMLLARDASGRVQYKAQSAPNSTEYSDWLTLDGVVSSDPVAIKDAEGRIAIFALGPDSHILCRHQKTPNADAWGDWYEMGGIMVGTPAVSINTDGRLEVFARNSAGEVWHYSQISPGGREWTGWMNLAGSVAGDLSVARNKDGRIEVFAQSSDGHIIYRVQREPSKSAIWDGWYTLGDAEPRF